MRQANRFDPCQDMHRKDFELQYKKDTYLKDVELHHHDFTRYISSFPVM